MRDFELDSVHVGPATRLLEIETDPEGGIFYQFGKRRPQCVQLPEAYGLRRFLVLDMVQTLAVLDPTGKQLVALAAFLSIGSRVVLFGLDWGRWIDEDGQSHRATNVHELMREWRFPVQVSEAKSMITIDFVLNEHNRDIFPAEVWRTFRSGPYRYKAAVTYSYPSGRFVTSNILVQTPGGQNRYIHDIDRFPLLLPEPAPQAGAPTNGQPSRPGATQGPTPRNDGRSAAGNHAMPRYTPPAAKDSGKPAERPFPQIDHLSTHELLNLLSTESDPERRWRMIEPNLMRGRPERTYPLVLNHTDLIAERVTDWPPARRRLAFSQQPAIVLTSIMRRWPVNQVLAIADVNAEADEIMEWLREREIERLLRIDCAKEPRTAGESRELLNVDRYADEAAIKKTWRVLLGFLNADHGRSRERAIHRKKDEVAKTLQVARNNLIKKK